MINKKTLAVTLFTSILISFHSFSQINFTLTHISKNVTASSPFSVSNADFNGDNILDLAVANQLSNDISILIGTGNGTFGVPTNFDVEMQPFCIAIGDFNGDSKLDLVVTNLNSRSISVLTGTGTGSFGDAINYAVGINPYCVKIGNFNNDNIQDIAVANYSSNNISILIGTGDGTFGNSTNISVGSGPRSIAINDFNKDGFNDIAVANNTDNTVSILTGSGTGGFNNIKNINVGTGPYDIDFADFNKDNKTDLVVVNNGSNNISVLKGEGTGNFETAVNYTVGTEPISVAIGDFNNDNINDLVTANVITNNVSVLTGFANGSFENSINFGVGTRPFRVSIGDFDKDGKQDVAVANNNDATKYVSILKNTSKINQEIIGLNFYPILLFATKLFPSSTTGNLLINYQSSDENILKFSQNSANATGIGVVTITAFENGNNIYNGVTVTGIITVNGLNLDAETLNFKNSSNFNVYPNPNEGSFFIETDGSVGFAYILNSGGQLIETSLLKENIKNYEIKLKTSGVYLVKLNTSTTQKTFKVIVY